jgi:uncharacterized membrane protein YfcA
VIFVPFFTIVFPLLGHRLEPVQAVEVGLLTEIFGFMSSTSAFWRAGLIDFKISTFALMFAVPTAIIGGVSAHLLPSYWLLVIIGAGLILFSFLLIREVDEKRKHDPNQGNSTIAQHSDRRGRAYRYQRQNDVWRAGTAAIGGVFQGLVGFSAGEMSTVEQVLRGVPMRLAAGNAHLIIAGASISAAFTHLAVDATTGSRIPWNILAATVPAVLIGGQIASVVAGRLSQTTLRLVLSSFLALIGVVSFYRASLAPQLHWHAWVVAVALVAITSGLLWLLFRRQPNACARPGGTCCSRVDSDVELRGVAPRSKAPDNDSHRSGE